MLPLTLLAMQLAGPLFGALFCLLRSGYEIFTLYGYCEYLLPQRLRVFFALFTFYSAFLIVLNNFQLLDTSTLNQPISSLIILAAGAAASLLLTGTVVGSIWRKMLG
jgi:hypothetical protein